MLATRTRADAATPYRAWGAGWVSTRVIAEAIEMTAAAGAARSAGGLGVVAGLAAVARARRPGRWPWS
ncbi:hypothetical protein [Nocardioides sp.]|uniref:hypothetical protein n=1 Tax=Nocardioides sp. TaxID=35761 RepID=UPI0025E05798|nr:hypothetical protein [Nocardioides sp.]